VPPEQPTGKTKHAELTLDEIASLLPGLGALMPQVGDRWWLSYYAAQGGNWALAGHELRELAKLLDQGSITRPKYSPQLTMFVKSHVGRLLRLVEDADLSGFKDAFAAATDAANTYHRTLGHPEIIWQLPPEPPQQLDLRPQPEGPSTDK
jgi:hypothetical protein